METVIILLLSVSILCQLGKCQEDVDVAPVEYNEVNGMKTLLCRFNVKVDCLWRNATGHPINISQYNYKYVDGQSSDTYNCSITAKSPWTKPHGLQCRGIIRPIPLALDPGDSVSLKCAAERSVNCAWSRDGSIINILNRYKYASGHNGSNSTDCSIVISSVTAKDNGNWTCYSKADDKSSQNSAIIVYQLQQYTARTSETDGTTSIIQSTVPSDNDQPFNHNVNETTQVNDNTFLKAGLSVALALIVLLFIYTCWHRNRRSKCRDAHSNERDNEQIGGQFQSHETSDGYLIPINAISLRNNQNYICNHYDTVNESPRAVCGQMSASNTDNDGYLIPITMMPKHNRSKTDNANVNIHQYESFNL